MRICLTLLLIVVNTTLLAQFSDDFEDGDFINSPSWAGQTANFIVNASNELQLNAPAVSDTSYLSLATTNINNITWTFYLRMEFNPSSSNLARVYLVSDNANLKGPLNGYFVMLGNTNDEISLFRQDGTTVTKIIDGLDGALNNDPSLARVRVTRDGAGNWELLRDTTGGINYFSEGTVLDATHSTNAHAGIYCKYSSTRSDKFFLDDFGDPYVDAVIPVLDTAIVISSTELDVQFSEAMEQSTAETVTNYSVDQGIGVPASAVLDGGNPNLLHLTFASSFVSGTNYTLTVNNVEDLANNPVAVNSTAPFYYFVSDVPSAGDVIVTEVFADPSPSVGLPEVEYIEIYNRSGKTFDLAGWTLWDASSSAAFSSYILAPDEYLLVCANGNGGQFFVANYTELALPSLNNSDDAVVIKDNLGNVIDSIYFESSWYGSSTKAEGGWSLERKHNDAPCNDASNWGASVDPYGGTPALQNSIWTNQNDVTPPFVTLVEVLSDTQVVLTFNEIMDTSISISGSLIPTTTWSSEGWLNLYKNSLNIQTMQVNTIYYFNYSAVADCWGNVSSGTVSFGIPDSVEIGDLILNEVMFDPLTNGSDYVELYNKSQKILDLQELYLADWDDSIANYKALGSNQRLILPGEYVLITEDSTDIIHDFILYGVGTFLQTDIPTYPNDSGTVYLLTKDSLIMDYFHYDEDYHFELISDPDGKSLERISFDGEMNDPDNWHTAAEYTQWGTPGYQNSQLFVANPAGEVSLDPKIFSPDNDGYQDFVTINLDLQTTDNVVDVEIFDNYGRLIRLLKDNYFVGNQATFTWDGITDKSDKAAIGTYIILVSIVDINGNQTQHKLVVVVAGNL